MNWVDYAFLIIIAISAVLSLWRGFVKEALSLLSWVIALTIALLFFEQMGDLLSGLIESPTIRNIVGFALLFFGTLILGGILNYLAGQLVAKTGLTTTDRMLGVIFGIARGIVIVALLVLLAGLTTLPKEEWWANSELLLHFQELALWIRSFLPESVAQHIEY